MFNHNFVIIFVSVKYYFMSRKIIKELFLFPNYKVIVFAGNAYYYTVKSGSVCYSPINKNADAVDTDFSNSRINVYNTKMLGKLSQLSDSKLKAVFSEARYKEDKYPNFTDIEGEKLISPLESFKSYLKSQGWDSPEDKTWIIIPTPSKKLNGKKLEVEFSLVPEDFGFGELKLVLPVYMDSIDLKTTQVNFSVEIPDYIYDFLMVHPDLELRPKSKVITSNVFSILHSELSELGNRCHNLIEHDKYLASARKVILVKYAGGQTHERDTWVHAYVGKKTSVSFRYFVGYQMKERDSMFDKTRIYSDKIHSHEHGFIPVKGRYEPVMDVSRMKIMDWTQEREDFLNSIEVNFKKLSDNLNDYLTDLDEDKLDSLISKKTKLLN